MNAFEDRDDEELEFNPDHSDEVEFDPDHVGNGPIPLFPLPNVFLIPGAMLPLHIFEPRYRRLVKDLLDCPGRLVIGTILVPDGGEPAEVGRVESLGGLGFLESYQALPDGRFLVLVRGLARVRVHECASSEPYRKVQFDILHDIPVPAQEEGALEEQLRDAIGQRAGPHLELPDGLAVSQLADLLIMHLKLPPETMSELFNLQEVSMRARRALNEHESPAA